MSRFETLQKKVIAKVEERKRDIQTKILDIIYAKAEEKLLLEFEVTLCELSLSSCDINTIKYIQKVVTDEGFLIYPLYDGVCHCGNYDPCSCIPISFKIEIPYK